MWIVDVLQTARFSQSLRVAQEVPLCASTRVWTKVSVRSFTLARQGKKDVIYAKDKGEYLKDEV